MDLDKFNVAVHRVRAGQFLREKTAAAVGVCAIDAALQARAEQVEDPDLFKIATQVCPEDALGFYMKLGGKLNKKPDWAGNIEAVLAKDEKEFPKRPKGESTNEYIDRTDREWATKKAEPAPPKGVSVKDWDKELQKGPEKEAAVLGKVRKLIAGKPPPGGYPPPVSLEDEAEQAAWEAKHRPAGVSATAYAPPWTPEERAHHLGEDKGKSR